MMYKCVDRITKHLLDYFIQKYNRYMKNVQQMYNSIDFYWSFNENQYYPSPTLSLSLSQGKQNLKDGCNIKKNLWVKKIPNW